MKHRNKCHKGRKVLVCIQIGLNGKLLCVAGLVQKVMTYGIHIMITGSHSMISNHLVVGQNLKLSNISTVTLFAALQLIVTSIDNFCFILSFYIK